MELHRWPAARTRRSNLLTESLDCSTENQELLSTVRLLRQSMLFNNGTQRASFDGGQLSSYSDADTVSSGSNSGTPEFNVPRQAKISSRGISIPHRFWQETNTTFRRLPELGMPRSSSGPRGSTTPKLSSIKRSLVDYPIQSPPSAPARLRGPVRPSSPSKLAGSPSPSRVNRTLVISSPAGLPANAPSIISFAAEVRRTKKGENRIEDAHMLRLLHNRQLLWRCVNARANASLMIQRGAAEKILYIAWITASEMHHSITSKKIKLHFLLHCLKLTAIFKDQLLCLEEWSLLEREHWSSLSGSIEALKASTMRLPIVSGCRADLQEVKDAVGSAVHVMQTLGSSTYFLMKVQGASYLVSELAIIAEQAQSLLDQSRELLSTVAALHVKLCSMRAHLLQLKRRFSKR
ncbi:hypothetical protein HPP92_023306 [Vanilla planifolia]|uniref:Uncharacterized protein n=1 Tax=Vanilla planifolia TaxID=51239 RepID=A0A835UG88_VANPL|nr:hypothetical protein HPP92_023306 [Vanilla planifolia]